MASSTCTYSNSSSSGDLRKILLEAKFLLEEARPYSQDYQSDRKLGQRIGIAVSEIDSLFLRLGSRV